MKEEEIRDDLDKLPALLSSPNPPPLCSQRNLLDSQFWPLPSYSKTHPWLLFDQIPTRTLLPCISRTLAILVCSQILKQVISSAIPLLASCLSPANPHLSELCAQATSYLGRASCDGSYSVILPGDPYHTSIHSLCGFFTASPTGCKLHEERDRVCFCSLLFPQGWGQCLVHFKKGRGGGGGVNSSVGRERERERELSVVHHQFLSVLVLYLD